MTRHADWGAVDFIVAMRKATRSFRRIGRTLARSPFLAPGLPQASLADQLLRRHVCQDLRKAWG